MATYRQAAAAALHAGGPLNYREIVKIAVEYGLLEKDDSNTRSVMLGSLSIDVRKKGEYSPFVKKGPGMFDLHPTLKAELGAKDFTGRPAYGPSPKKQRAKKAPKPRAGGRRAAGKAVKPRAEARRAAKTAAGPRAGGRRAAGKAVKPRAEARRAAKKAAGPRAGGVGAPKGAAGKKPVQNAVPADPKPAKAADKAPRRARKTTPVGGRVRKAARTNSRIAGRAGGHTVMSELLFRGFDAGLMGTGGDADIIARRGGNTYGIRVSTADGWKVLVRIPGTAEGGKMRRFYVIVIRQRDGRNKYIIMPLESLRHCTERGFVRLAGDTFQTTITMGGGRATLGDKVNDVSPFVDYWDGIK